MRTLTKSNVAAAAPKPGDEDQGADAPISLGELSDYIGFYLRITQALSFQAEPSAGAPA